MAFGSEVAAAAVAAATSQLPYANTGNEAAANRLFLTDYGGTRSLGTFSNKSSSPEGSTCASPLSLSLNRPSSLGIKLSRSADSPGNRSATPSTTRNRDKPFLCQICNKAFGYKHVLQNHERTHTGEKPFQCKECLKRFTRDHHLKTHMRLHTGEKPFHCEHCDKDFVQVANLRRHLRVHTGERPYACDVCTSKFSDSNQLKAHKLIHRGVKPFNCEKCLGRFRRRHHLNHHKCPKDEANFGRPRRGRKPKAYDSLNPTLSLISSHQAHSLNSSDEAHSLTGSTASNVSSSTVALAVAATSSFYQYSPNFQVPSPMVPSTTPPAAHSGSAVSGSGVSSQLITSDSAISKSRRKPTHPFRIMSRHQRNLFLHDPNSMQTAPLNMSLSSSYAGPIPLTLPRASPLFTSKLDRNNHLHLHHHPHENVLDLSRSRSDVDSEAEPIEEEVMEDDVDEDEEDDLEEYDSEHYENETIKDTLARQFVSSESRDGRLSPRAMRLLPSNLKLMKDNLVSPTEVPSEILFNKKLRINDNPNDAHGKSGLNEMQDLTENGAIQLTTKAKTTSCS